MLCSSTGLLINGQPTPPFALKLSHVAPYLSNGIPPAGVSIGGMVEGRGWDGLGNKTPTTGTCLHFPRH